MKTIEEAAYDYSKSMTELRLNCQQTNSCLNKEDYQQEGFIAGAEFARRWIPIEEGLPPHLVQCEFKLNNGNICIGKCNYFEYGDSELIEMYGKGLSYAKHTYRNWELHDFKHENYFKVTHWRPIELK